MKALSSEQMKAFDRWAVRHLGLPVLVLMENAGRAVANTACDLIRGKRNARIIVFCGGGNNGGDGVVAARYLHQWRFQVTVFWMKNPRTLSGDAHQHFDIARRAGVSMFSFKNCRPQILRRADLLIDALLGTGTRGTLRQEYQAAIEAMNASKRPILAVDVPSGLDADTGKSLGVVVKAKATVTLVAPKVGLIKPIARPYIGHLTIADIGLPMKK